MIPKFRAWLKEENKMIEPSDILSISFKLCEMTPNYLYGFEKEKYNFHDLELMQSTGLVDKEDTEVFEGDLLHHQIQTDYTFIVKYDEDNARWYGDGLSRTYRIDLMKHFMQYYKVIGNIYENPELLEVK